ncbi:Protein ODORANT1 [Glycine max]|nr:Protein ODORANT1 [Glycine max]
MERKMKELEASESSAYKKMLPLSVETGGCVGFQVFERDGIKLVVDNISYDFVKGTTVDYVEELSSHSFLHREPCCDKVGLKNRPWTAEEDKKLISSILTNGQCCWRAVPKLAAFGGSFFFKMEGYYI